MDLIVMCSFLENNVLIFLKTVAVTTGIIKQLQDILGQRFQRDLRLKFLLCFRFLFWKRLLNLHRKFQ